MRRLLGVHLSSVVEVISVCNKIRLTEVAPRGLTETYFVGTAFDSV